MQMIFVQVKGDLGHAYDVADAAVQNGSIWPDKALAAAPGGGAHGLFHLIPISNAQTVRSLAAARPVITTWQLSALAR